MNTNTTTVDSTGKGMGEADNSAGGATVPDDAGPKMPVCPKCKTNENVEALKGSDGKYFQCKICGERMKDDDGDGEMMDAVDPAKVDNKTTVVAGNDPDHDGDTDPIVVCPLCREPAKMTGDVEVSGLGPCDTYECPKCGNKFLQPEGAHRAPELNGNQDGTPQQNANGEYAAPPLTDKSVGGGKVLNTACESRALGLIREGKVSDGTWEAPNGGDRKEEDCLGRREGADVTPSEKFTDPIIKGGTLYRHAVADVESRESGSSIGAAAKRIMAAMQEKKTVKPFVRPETVLAAVDRKRKQNAAALAAQLVPIVHEALDKRQGRV